jgi:hypothetical protein
MAKAGNNRERAVAAATAEEKDCGGKSEKGLGGCQKKDGSRSKLANWLRGEGFGSISIYIESQTVTMSIAVSPARIAKEYRLPNSPNWDIKIPTHVKLNLKHPHPHRILSRGQNLIPGTKLFCPGDKILSWGQNSFVPLCPGQNNFVPAVYIACAKEQDCDCLSGHFGIFFD